jgi:hypothetical protein
MAIRFTPCPACARHVREGDATCPFCGATSLAPAELPRALSSRLSRAAFLALGAAGAIAATDCASSSAPVPAYGGLPPVEGGLLPLETDAGDAGFAQPLYGAVVPLPDGGSEDAAGSEREGGFAQPLYGAIAVPYGLPPGGGKR